MFPAVSQYQDFGLELNAFECTPLTRMKTHLIKMNDTFKALASSLP